MSTLGMVSMTNASESMATPMSGKHSPSFSIICPWLLWLKAKSSVSMVVFRLLLIPLIRSDSSTVYKRFLMKDPSATSYGLTPMTDAAGVSHQEVLATLSVRTSRNSLITPMVSSWYPELINWWWMATTGLMKGMWSLCSRLQTTATAAVTRLLSWR